MEARSDLGCLAYQSEVNPVVYRVKLDSLATYAHFMPDDDRAREIMNAFFALTREGADHDPCALIVPGDRHE